MCFKKGRSNHLKRLNRIGSQLCSATNGLFETGGVRITSRDHISFFRGKVIGVVWVIYILADGELVCMLEVLGCSR
jgi:hypothetical protein